MEIIVTFKHFGDSNILCNNRYSLPVENEYEDEYTKATKASELDCNEVYSKRCQYSILGYFMSKDRPII